MTPESTLISSPLAADVHGRVDGAHEVDWLVDNADAYDKVLRAIQSAEESIWITQLAFDAGANDVRIRGINRFPQFLHAKMVVVDGSEAILVGSPFVNGYWDDAEHHERPILAIPTALPRLPARSTKASPGREASSISSINTSARAQSLPRCPPHSTGSRSSKS